MSGIAVAVDWSRPDAGEESVRRMLAAMPHRSPDGTQVASAPHCTLGFALRATTARERAAAQPLHDPLRGLWIVGDARIDNREEVARTLGLPAPPASDAALLLRGFANLGVEVVSQLEGDFALVAWDEHRRVLVAARDVMGLRPLFWRATGRGLLLATEVDALLEGGGRAEVEPAAVLDFLLHQDGPVTRTFFRGVQRLAPGHVLEATAGGMRDLGHARPPLPRPAPVARGEEVPGFRHLLWQAVSNRLESQGPLVLALSGGLDSSAIACVAEDLNRHEPRRQVPLVLASAVLRGFAGDDTPFLDAVVARVRFPCQRWDVSAVPPAGPEALPRAHPQRSPIPSGASRALEVARALGSRVLLMGVGGDEVLGEVGVFEDLARHGRLLALARETLRRRPYTASPGHRLLLRALRAAAPSWARLAFRSFRPRRPPPPPTWLGPTLAKLWPPPAPPRPEPIPSRVQAGLLAVLSGEDQFLLVEQAEQDAARAGLQLRLPFLDRPLVEWVRSIPWQRRRPRGLVKRLLRDAMAGTWPDELAHRRAVSIADDCLVWSVSRAIPLLAPVVEGSRWESGKFVDQREARRLLTSIRGASTLANCVDLWNILALEAWLRELAR
ncbi:MAG TPA: asparagine synthase-related protein [Anaeromyxobacteraceae bacterium]|nr:asparagine synthase-related protein [Anaeromyxobacteraceae bacterium]